MADGKKSPKERPRPSAIVRAEHGGTAIRLSSAEKRIFEEALRRGEDLADDVQSKVSAYGRWLLATVFDNDATVALDEKTKHPVWLELVRRAGGPTLRIGRRMLYVALQVAANDKRITDDTWRRLDAGRKEILLPLDDPRSLRDAAEHVSKFSRISKLRESLDGAAVMRRVRAMQTNLDTADRQSIAAEIDKLREVLSAIAREMRGR